MANKAVVELVIGPPCDNPPGFATFYSRDGKKATYSWPGPVRKLTKKIMSQSAVAPVPGKNCDIVIPQTEVAEMLVNQLALRRCHESILEKLGNLPLEKALTTLLARRL